VYLGAYFTEEEISVTPFEGFSGYKSVLHIKKSIAENIMTVLPNESGGLIAAMLFGDCSVLEKKRYQTFEEWGFRTSRPFRVCT
jgi:predicted membrane metal-binding protein